MAADFGTAVLFSHVHSPKWEMRLHWPPASFQKSPKGSGWGYRNVFITLDRLTCKRQVPIGWGEAIGKTPSDVLFGNQNRFGKMATMDIENGARRKERVTIRDVAAACRVAISTASNALAGRDCVTEETRQRVLEVAKDLGYRPSAVARSLRMRRSWTIGLLVGDITNPFFPELVRGAEDAAAAQNYNLILCNTDYRIEKQDAYLRHLRDKQADGVIMASQISGSSVIEEFIEEGLPFVMINQAFPGIETDYVGVDNVHGVGVLCDHLWKLGHREIAFIKGREGSTAAADRFEGFARAMQSLAGRLDVGLIEQGDYSYVSGATGTRRLLARKDRPTAIVAANDLMALGALEAAAAEGLKVPENISIVGIDDIFISSLPSVNLTTLRQPKWELGAAAVRLILAREKFSLSELKRVTIKPELVLRATTGPARTGA